MLTPKEISQIIAEDAAPPLETHRQRIAALRAKLGNVRADQILAEIKAASGIPVITFKEQIRAFEKALPGSAHPAPAKNVPQKPPRSSVLELVPRIVAFEGNFEEYCATLVHFYIAECKTDSDRKAFVSSVGVYLTHSKTIALLGITAAILAGETPSALDLRIFNAKAPKPPAAKTDRLALPPMLPKPRNY